MKDRLRPATLRGAVSSVVVAATLLLSSPCVSPVGAQAAAADLSVRVVDAPDPVSPGTILTYRITVIAAGRRAARDVLVSSAVPASTTFEAFEGPRLDWTFETPPQGGTGAVRASTPSLETNRPVIFELSVRVSANLPDGTTISNTVTVEGAQRDPNSADNVAETATTVQVVPPSTTDVRILSTLLQEPVATGELLIITIRTPNAGLMAATDVEVRFDTPPGTVFASATASGGELTTPLEGTTGEVICRLAVLPADRLLIMTIALRVAAFPGAEIETLATVSTSSIDPVPANNMVRRLARVVEPGAPSDIVITLANVPERALTGETLTFDTVVQNDGPADSDVVTAIIPVPSGTRFVSALAERGEVLAPPPGLRGAVAWRLIPLERGESATITITVRVRSAAGTPVVTTAFVTSRVDDIDLTNNLASAETRVQSVGDTLVQWDPPDLTSGDPAPPPLSLIVLPSVLGKAAETHHDSTTRADGRSPLAYNLYASNTPGVQPNASNFFTTVPPNQTTLVVPVAPGGSFFTVTAVYPNGESASSNSDGTGDKPGPTLTSVKVASSKITAKGSGFTETAQVFIDGIPFVEPAKVNGAMTRTLQRGTLLTGQTIEQYLSTGSTYFIVFRNSDGGITVYEPK